MNGQMEDLSIIISASVVAWYGAILATLGFVFSVYNILRDRAKIKILFKKNIWVKGGVGLYKPGVKYLNITVINIGRRPVRIEKAALKIAGEKGSWLLSDSFVEHRNKVLTEESPRTEFLADRADVNVDRIWYVSIYDGHDNEYRKYLHPFPTFWRFFDRVKHHN